jgi:hypothetical protein
MRDPGPFAPRPRNSFSIRYLHALPHAPMRREPGQIPGTGRRQKIKCSRIGVLSAPPIGARAGPNKKGMVTTEAQRAQRNQPGLTMKTRRPFCLRAGRAGNLLRVLVVKPGFFSVPLCLCGAHLVGSRPSSRRADQQGIFTTEAQRAQRNQPSLFARAARRKPASCLRGDAAFFLCALCASVVKLGCSSGARGATEPTLCISGPLRC